MTGVSQHHVSDQRVQMYHVSDQRVQMYHVYDQRVQLYHVLDSCVQLYQLHVEVHVYYIVNIVLFLCNSKPWKLFFLGFKRP